MKISYSPNFPIVPIDNGMNPHEIRPPVVRPIEMRQKLAMRIRSPRADKYSLHGRVLGKVCFERGFHGERVTREVKPIVPYAILDEGVDFGEGMRGHDVY